MKRLGAKLPWKPFGIVEEVIDPQGEGRAEVVGMEIGAHNHSLLRGAGEMTNVRQAKLRGCHLKLKKKYKKFLG